VKKRLRMERIKQLRGINGSKDGECYSVEPTMREGSIQHTKKYSTSQPSTPRRRMVEGGTEISNIIYNEGKPPVPH
jgi:hypothetical protein